MHAATAPALNTAAQGDGPSTARPANLQPADLRAEFPELDVEMNGKPLVFLDSGATSLKPRAVIDAVHRFYSEQYGTTRRGAYKLSHVSTAMFEDVRKKAARFFHAHRPEEIVFVRGVTEGINLVATSLSRGVLQPGDEVVITAMEHHANIVPWQLIREQTGLVLRVVPMDERGVLDWDAFERIVGPKTRVVSVIHVANSLGTVNDVRRAAELAHAHGAICLVDGAQSAPHLPVDVQALGCDLYVCSGHKMCGPTGVGVLWGRYDLLAELPPYQGGGEMIDQVTFEQTTFDDPPYRFEAGTPPIAQVIGLGAALDWLEGVGMERIARWDAEHLAYATERLEAIDGLRIIGTSPAKSGLVTFVMDDAHPSDIGMILDKQGVCIRAGHHCAQPVMRHFGVPATARASFGPYTTRADIDALADGLEVVRSLFS